MDTPTITLIIAVVVLFMITTGLGITVYRLLKQQPAPVATAAVGGPGGILPPAIPSFIERIISPFLSKLFEYSSLGLFSFGFVEFLISQKWDGLIPNLFAILALVTNNFLKQGFGIGMFGITKDDIPAGLPDVLPMGPAPPPPPLGGAWGQEFCSVPGLGGLANSGKGPGSIVLVTTIMFHYLVTIWSNGGGTQSITPSLTLLTLWSVHAWTVINNCARFSLLDVVISILIGLLFGVFSWTTAKYGLNKGGSPGSGTAGSLLGAPKGGGLGSTGPTSPPGVGTCSAPNDQDQFVCEAYKNGELITTTIVE
jgi:hypothetical protein